MIVQQLEEQEQINHQVKERLELHTERIDDLEAKILSIDENYYSISGYCALNSIDCPLDKAQKWGLGATKLSNSKGVSIGKAYDAKYALYPLLNITKVIGWFVFLNFQPFSAIFRAPF